MGWYHQWQTDTNVMATWYCIEVTSGEAIGIRMLAHAHVGVILYSPQWLGTIAAAFFGDFTTQLREIQKQMVWQVHHHHYHHQISSSITGTTTEWLNLLFRILPQVDSEFHYRRQHIYTSLHMRIYVLVCACVCVCVCMHRVGCVHDWVGTYICHHHRHPIRQLQCFH